MLHKLGRNRAALALSAIAALVAGGGTGRRQMLGQCRLLAPAHGPGRTRAGAPQARLLLLHARKALVTHHKRLAIGAATLVLAALAATSAARTAAVLLCRAVLSARYGPYVLLAPALLAAGVLFNTRLKRLNVGWLEWAPFHMQKNIALVPLTSRRLWAPYGLMLAFCMPLMALIEEVIFRAGTTGWVRGVLWGGLAFGAFHIASMVSVRMLLYLSLIGLLLVAVYAHAGLTAVFVVHASYNLLALALLIAEQRLRTGSLLRPLANLVGRAQ